MRGQALGCSLAMRCIAQHSSTLDAIARGMMMEWLCCSRRQALGEDLGAAVRLRGASWRDGARAPPAPADQQDERTCESKKLVTEQGGKR